MGQKSRSIQKEKLKKMKNKFKIVKINKVKLAVENKKWETPMKPRIPTVKTHQDDRWPSRAKSKREFKQTLKKEGYR